MPGLTRGACRNRQRRVASSGEVARANDSIDATNRSARPLAITNSMLALCSSAWKALRFASTALARGLRALTPPPRSSINSNYVMVLSVNARPGAGGLAEFFSGVHPPGSNRAFSCS
jgi:hypothetical protein